MNRKELIYSIRKDAKELEALMKKMQVRCDHLNWLADQVEAAGAKPEAPKPESKTKFRKIVDSIYGEKR